MRDRIDRRYPSIADNEVTLPGFIKNADTIPGGVRINYQFADLEIIELAPGIIRISWGPGNPSYPYTLNKQDWEIRQPIIEHIGDGYSIHSEKYNLSVSNIGEITFCDTNQNTLRKDEAPIRKGKAWRLASQLSQDEHIYGLGERAAPLNLRPGRYRSWNTDAEGNYTTGQDPLYIGTPVYLSLSNSGSYLVYYENSYPSVFDIGDKFEASFDGGMLRYYLIIGSLESIYKQYGELIGKSILPPRWALGYHQCRWGYKTESDIRKVIEGFEENDLPISAIHLDIDYMDGYRVFTVNPKRFGNLKGLTRDLDKKGIKVVSTINPAVKLDADYDLYRDGLKKNVFCKLPDREVFRGVSWPGWSVFPDFSNPETRDWWQTHYHHLLDLGVSGIWHDMNEPSSFAAWGDKTLPNATQHSMDGAIGDHREFHNLYGLLMSQAGFQALKNYSPAKRPWIFSRSGWAGLQRYAWNWTGDVETSWSSLQQTLPTILGLGLSGHQFSGVDIGGFSGNPDAELYLRWFQLAIFFPLCRTHSAIGTQSREPWVYGEPTTSIIRNLLKLRYKLMPYLYTQAWVTSQTGAPFIRPLFWQNPQNPDYWDVQDEYMVGDNLLIAPVLEQGVVNRQVSLPSGSWYSFWDDQLYSGANIQFKVEPQSLPIFVKAGTILPMEIGGGLTLHIYPDMINESQNSIYTDAGDGYGPWRFDVFNTNFSSGSLEILRETEGEYAFPYPWIKIQVHGYHLSGAIIDDVDLPAKDNSVITSIFNRCRLKLD